MSCVFVFEQKTAYDMRMGDWSSDECPSDLVKLLVGKPGLDGHSIGAEQIAVKARDCGMEVVYEGIRLTPEQIVAAALEEGVHLVGLSILSGSHVELATEVMERMRKDGIGADRKSVV